MGVAPAAPARASHTIGPRVRFGTKWLSITSKWMRSAPARTTASTSSPSRAKSAARRDGAIHTERAPAPAAAGAPVLAPAAEGLATGSGMPGARSDTAGFVGGGVTPGAGAPRSRPPPGGRAAGTSWPSRPGPEG